jgi:hypothetical protein
MQTCLARREENRLKTARQRLEPIFGDFSSI